jgi:rhomboid family GlyGly-CTERM serine protease
LKIFLWLLGALVLGLALLGDAAQWLLRWDRDALAAGEVWRLVSGHLVHLDLYHAALNIFSAILLAALFGKVFRFWQVLLIVTVAMAIIDTGLWWLSDVDWYVGLSGVLHAFAAAAVVRSIIDRHDPLAWALAVFGLAKIGWENIVGALPLTPSATLVVTDVHLYGVLAGMLTGLLLRRFSAAA